MKLIWTILLFKQKHITWQESWVVSNDLLFICQYSFISLKILVVILSLMDFHLEYSVSLNKTSKNHNLFTTWTVEIKDYK